MEKFDLTTESGFKNVANFLGDNLLLIFNPKLGIAKYIIDKITDLRKSFNVQRDAAIELIKKGKEQGVDDMEIVMDNKRGFKLNVPMEDVKIDALVGADDKMHIKVKYK